MPPGAVASSALSESISENRPSSQAATIAKDLIDLALIASEATLDAGRLRAAIETTFERRASHELPTSLPRPPADWRVPYGRMARTVGLEADLDAGFDSAARMLEPLPGRTVQTRAWDPSQRTWS